MIPLCIWNIFSHLKRQHKFIFIGCGDRKQLAPPEEEHIQFEDLQIVKELFRYNSYELCKVWRFDDSELLQDADKASNGEAVDYTTYGDVENELSLCHTNDAVDAINTLWNQRHAELCDNKKEVIGFDNTKYIIYKGLILMAYKTQMGNIFTNSQELTIHSWSDDKFILLTQANIQIELDIKYTTSFKPRYAMTIPKSQGSTFTVPYSICEYKQMKANMLYVALTRARDKGQINFCDISNHTPYKGYIYSYVYKGKR
jgi:hypothetical protein